MAPPAASTRPRISREFIEAHRRRRYVEAATEILHEFGRQGVTAGNILRVAGGARNSFYEVFGSVEHCLAHGVELADAHLFEVLRGEDGGAGWPAELAAAIEGFYGAVASAPLLAELFLIHSAALRSDAGRRAAWEGGGRFAELIGRGAGAAEVRGGRPPTAAHAEYLSRAVVALAAARVRGPRVRELPAEARAMTLLVGRFYLGEAAEEMFATPVS